MHEAYELVVAAFRVFLEELVDEDDERVLSIGYILRTS